MDSEGAPKQGEKCAAAPAAQRTVPKYAKLWHELLRVTTIPKSTAKSAPPAPHLDPTFAAGPQGPPQHEQSAGSWRSERPVSTVDSSADTDRPPDLCSPLELLVDAHSGDRFEGIHANYTHYTQVIEESGEYLSEDIEATPFRSM